MVSTNKSENVPNSTAELTQDSNKPLQTNPFTTYRDPQTGQWIVINPVQTNKAPGLGHDEVIYDYSSNQNSP